MAKFNADIANSSLLISPASDLNDLIKQHDSVLSSVLDSHAPCAECVVTIRPLAPWYIPEIRAGKTKRLKLQQRWCQSRLTIELYLEQCDVVRKLIQSAKHVYFSNLINKHQSDQKVLYSSFAKVCMLFQRKKYPDCVSSNLLATSFANFFETKVLNIQHDLSVNPIHVVFNDVIVLSYLSRKFHKMNFPGLLLNRHKNHVV